MKLKLKIECLKPNPFSLSLSTSTSQDEEESQKRPPLDKKLRRQIANSNERRRMQSINSGFHTLRMLMPHLQGEKLSKVRESVCEPIRY